MCFVGRVMRQIVGCWGRRTVASGGEYHRIGVSIVKFHPAKTMVGAARFDFPTPVKNTILAQSYVSAMAPTDIKKHLSVDALRTSRRTCIGKNGRIKAVVWVDRYNPLNPLL